MDYLFGKEIDHRYYKKFLVNGKLVMTNFDKFIIDNTWSINKRMITQLSNVPNYNDKKILVYD